MLDFFLNNRWLVLILMLGLLVGGIYTMLHLNIEAYPDLTNVQVVVTAEAPGMSPVEVEQLVTFPVETSMLGMPKLQIVRSVSKLGLSMVTIVFDDSMQLYLARQLVNERLGEVRGRMPPGVQPVMNPMITAFGEVYQFTLQGGPRWGLMQLKTLLDWDIRYDLRKIPGVSEVNSWGGYTKQYTVEVDPLMLRRYGLTVHDVVQRVADNNANFGGGFIEHNEEQYNIRGLGRTTDVNDLGRIVVLSHNGVPVLLRDLAKIETLPYPRQGAIMRDGKGESVCGMVITLKGTNSRQIIQDVKQHIQQMKLPPGVHITPFYDQSRVIDDAIRTIEHNLFEAGVLVVCVLLVFLGNWRAALIVASVIPLALLFGFLGMMLFGVSANLMSLGALDFGMIVDGSVVMVENFIHRMENESEEENGKSMVERIRPAVHEMAKPVTFGVLIIIAVYMPIFTLQGLEGRMFHPMAVTVCSALTGSLLLALFAIPTISSFVLSKKQLQARKKKNKENWFSRLRKRYLRSLEWALRHRWPILATAAALVAGAIVSLKFIGTEFMPKLDEVEIVCTSRKLPGISLDESIYLGERIEKVLRSFPEVKNVVSKLGRPDFATEAMGVEETDSYLMLAPKNTWKCCQSKDELIDQLSKRLNNEIPGAAFVFTQPMEMRMDEVVTGIRGDLALKIFGPDLYTLDRLGTQAVALISSVRGASEVQKDSSMGIAELNVKINRTQLDRYGLNVSDVQELIETMLGGKQVSEMVEGEQRFRIAVRLPRNYRDDIDKLGDLYMMAPGGARVQLRQVADLRTVQGPEMVNREDARRRVAVEASVRGRDLGGFVKAAQAKVTSGMKIPPGYTLDWGGQFANEKEANQRLLIVLPVSIVMIFGLLFATFRNARQALLILLIVPFALVGGIAALWLRGLNLSLSASIGFIALFGVAVLNGVVMVSHIDALKAKGRAMMDAIKEGAVDRLRPVLMTALVASLGFIPMAVSRSRGAEVQRPLATVVIGGLITATILTLYLLPMLYPWFTPKEMEQGQDKQKSGDQA